MKKFPYTCKIKIRFSQSLPLSPLSISQLTYLYVNGWNHSYEPTYNRLKHGTSGLSRKKQWPFNYFFFLLNSLYIYDYVLQTLGIYHSENIVISNLKSLNSQMFHILLYACNDAKLQGVSILASETSPNTDGIHLSLSTGITILGSTISTGDDCVSIGPGNYNVWIEKVTCGPGHGIRYIYL